jgi:prepilin-type N-terminal cleavage/methylation domain-containing protein
MPKSVATKQGFTIVELLIAIAVVAVLVAVSVVTY